MDIVLFGIQGSGKGTLGKAIAEEYGYKYFETGHELRKLSAQDSSLGRKVKKIVEAGKLVPDNIVMEIIENFMKEENPGENTVIFDGIPRKTAQAKLFDKLMKKLKRPYKGILVDVPEETAIKRLTTRRICSKCKEVYPANYEGSSCKKCGGELITRSDDTPDSIKTRIQVYKDETVPVIDDFNKKKMLIVMNGDQSIPDAREEIFEVIETLL
jgi:adenylate kinase